MSPLSPLGIVKSNTAALEVQLFTTLALVHASQVVVLHTVIVAAVPVSPLSHLSHCSPCIHCSHCGQVRVVTAFAKVTVFQSVSQNTISSPLNEAEFILAHVAQVAPVAQVSP